MTSEKNDKTNFRVIAIKTGNKPNEWPIEDESGIKLDFLKVLKENTIYPFYNCFQFHNNNFEKITYNKEQDIDLYNLSNSSNKIKININAIVGKNGSGKSSLIELLFWANYNIGAKLQSLYNYDKDFFYKPNLSLQLEILYSTKVNSLHKISFSKGEIYSCKYSRDGSKYRKGAKSTIKKNEQLKNFFYSLVVNYSHYALNTKEIGQWIKPLFHKNDGYQTPIVLNPMRTEGNVDINKENALLDRRLQANLLEYVEKGKEKNSLRNIANGKIAQTFELTLKDKQHPYQSLFNAIETEFKKNHHKEINKKLFALKADAENIGIINPLTKNKQTQLKEQIVKVFDFKGSGHCCQDESYLDVSLSYIYQKLIRIAKNYRRYDRYLEENDSISNFYEYLVDIKNDNSHVTFKIKGVIFYLKYFTKIFTETIYSKAALYLDISDLATVIREIKNKETETCHVNTFMMSPPAFFNTKIILEDNLPIHSLSSGEKQRIHSLSSIVYHLINLNSVEQLKSSDIVSYNYINLILDEIELYYHPDWQRRFIKDLLDYISFVDKDNLNNINGLNITFLTHSPYILSDIPSQNILFLGLEDKQAVPLKNLLETFGANIHDLLKDGFFMENGFMGEYVKNKINESIAFLNISKLQKQIHELEKQKEKKQNHLEAENIDSEIKKSEDDLQFLLKISDINPTNWPDNQPPENLIEHHLQIIKSIGEPVLRNKLESMHNDLFQNEDEKKKQFEQLARELGAQFKYN